MILYNFVRDNQLTTGYFQGLNFVAYYIVVLAKDDLWSVSILKYISEYIYNVRFSSPELL